MKRILVIAPKCYPVNGAEAIVNIKLLKALSEDGGFEIDLVSRKNLKIVYPSDSIESYGVTLHGLYVVENQGGFSLKVLIDSIRALFKFNCIFPGCHWAIRVLPIINNLLKDNHYDFVLTKSAPSFVIGSYLKKKGLKWVASWNDPYPPSFYPAPYGKGKNHKYFVLESLQLKQMKKADIHVFPTEALKSHMLSYLHINEEKCFVVPHVVFDLPALSDDKTQSKDGILRIIHSGNLSKPRNPRPVINALNNIVVQNPDIKILFTFLGKLEQYDKEYIDSFVHLKEHIQIVPMVEYNRSLEILKTQDVACVIEADCGVGGGVFLPTKVTDFLQCNKPILAVSPKDGVLEELYNRGSIGYFSDIHNENSIYESLQTIYNDYINNCLKKSHVPQSFRPEAIVVVYKTISSLLS